MKILITAAACNPYLGSEPGVGWAAVCRIACDHEVFVLTDSINREGWEKGSREGIIPQNVKVRFLRKATKYVENRFIARIQSWLWYTAFNRLVLAAALDWHKEEQFDLCHQVTIAAWRVPSPLWQLPIPFVWGPIGGAGYIPPNFRSMLSLQARFFERARDISTAIASRSSAFRNCMQKTTVVFAANKETEEFLLPFRGDLPMTRLPVLSVTTETIVAFRRKSEAVVKSGPLQLFAGGNIEGRKGVSLAIKALAKAKDSGVIFRYTVSGGGPEIEKLKQLTAELGLTNEIHFHPGYSGQDYIDALQASDIYFLPSFRETMGMTLVEAILAGCYPIVADTSAQGEIVSMTGGTAVPLINIEEMVEGLAQSVIACNARRDRLFTEMEMARSILCEYLHDDRYSREIASAYALCKKKNCS